jgi:hypothetical protein
MAGMTSGSLALDLNKMMRPKKTTESDQLTKSVKSRLTA